MEIEAIDEVQLNEQDEAYKKTIEEVEQKEEPQKDNASDDAELVVELGEAEIVTEEKEAPPWVKKLRQDYKEAQKEIRLLKAQTTPQAAAAPTLPERPKLSDFDYDDAKYESAIDAWHEKKMAVDAVKKQQLDEIAAKQKEADQAFTSYKEKAASLKVKDFEDAENEVTEQLSKVQQGVLLEAANNPALLVYGLGKNPSKLEELSKIKSLARFAAQVGIMEASMKTSNKPDSKPPPEGTLRGSSGVGATQTRLDELKKKADQSGDYTDYFAAKRKK